MGRKDYAITGQRELQSFDFTLAMQYYNGKEPNWKEFFIRQLKKIDWENIS